MKEEQHFGKMDLPQSIGYIIARLIQQKFPRKTTSINRDGTIIMTFKDKEKMEQNKIIELELKSMYFKYEVVDTKTISEETKCRHCGSDYIKTIHCVTYELTEIWQGRHNVTERYKIGGDLTESKIGISALRREVQQSEAPKVAIYT